MKRCSLKNTLKIHSYAKKLFDYTKEGKIEQMDFADDVSLV